MSILTSFRTYHYVLLVVVCCTATSLFGQNLSADLSSLHVDVASVTGPVEVYFDEAKLLRSIKAAPQRFSRNGTAPKEVALPGPDGKVEDFQLERVQTMHPDLQAKYPEIMSFAGWKSDDPTLHVRAEFSPDQGWTIAYRSRNAERVAIRPKQTANGRAYERVTLSDVEASTFSCLNSDEGVEHSDAQAANPNYQAMRAGDCELRQYRLAVSCTGEYARAVGGPTPTVASVLAAMNTAVNRLNEVYERDMGITMQLIADNEDIIYLNASTDPYTNGSAGAMIDESQLTIDAVIGDANYDIGHLFGTAGAGLAALQSVCRTGRKASGITGIGNPTGDFFYIDYVAHEIGHQFGATHTFYNSCSGNRTNATAVEPGSGGTIMAYAGICSPNVQSRSDDLFHSVSLAQMSAFITGGNHTCPVISNTSNTPPTVTLPQNSYTIPVSTAFELIADASDPDGTSLTYTWEQIDNELGGAMPPETTNTDGPMFLALNVTPDPRRRFPSGINPTYEVLPSVARDMDFRVTVRDNDSRYGCTAEADVRVSTTGNTPFEITNYNTTATLEGLSTYTVEWEVAGTNSPPFNAPLVNIYLSLDGGYTYDYNLAEMVPNDGSADVTLPNINSTTARFVVKGHDQVFLDVNDVDLTIQEPVIPTFSLASPQTTGFSCAGADVTYQLDIGSVLGFSESVNLSTASLPAGTSASFTNNGQSGTFSSVMTISGLGNVANGTYTFDVVGLAGGQQRSLAFTLEVKQIPAGPGVALLPLDGADEGLVFTEFSWAYDANIGSVRFELSGDPTFPPGSFSQLFDQASINASGIAAGVYFWRVAYENECGRGPWSALRSFRKIPLDEEVFSSTGPVTIGTGGPATYSSSITVPRQGDVYQVEFATQIMHTYVGDLDADVSLPGLGIELFGQSAGGGCEGNNIDAIFADDSNLTSAAFVATCTNNIPSITGVFQPVDLVYTSLPREGSGTYTINVRDNATADGGSITAWDVTLWYSNVPEFNETQTIDTIRVTANGTVGVNGNNLAIRATGLLASQTIYVIKVLAAEGELQRNGVALGLGSTFSQADIDNGSVSFVHTAMPTSGFDAFTVDAILPNVGYFSNLEVPVRITVNNLLLTGGATGEILCSGDLTAGISVNPSGGMQPYMYRLDNGAFQSDPNFSGLGAGTYSVTVRDVNGLTYTLTPIVIDEPSPLTLTASATGSTINAQGNGGTSPYTYSIGAAFQPNGVFQGLADASYTVTVRDANGCDTTQTVVVAASNLTVTLEIEVPILCNGDLGMLVATAANGVPPYSYSLNNGPSQTSMVFENVPEGTYTVIATDALGNTANSRTVTLVEPEVLTATATAASNTITVNPTGGTPSYTYNLAGGAPQTSNTFTGLNNGSYTIEVSDANGCTTSVQATVNVNMLSVALQIVQPILCNGDVAVLRANVSGGPAPYTFRLNNGTPQSSPDFNNIPAGSYTVAVTDGDGNTATSTATLVEEPPVLIVIASVSGRTITATPGGGTSPYQYSIDGTNFQPSNVFNGVANGTYTLTLRDANGCTATTSITVNVMNMTVSLEVLEAIACNGGVGTLRASASGGTAPYMYSLDGGSPQSDPVFLNVPAGTYTVVATDANGNTATSNQVVLNEPNALTATTTVSGTTITVFASGGTAPYMYRLGTGGMQTSEVFAGVNPGTYTITISDANGCLTTTSATVATSGTLAVGVTFNLGQESCPGTADGAVTLAGANGQPPYEYSLDGVNFRSGTFFNNLAAGNYTATVRDATGATATSTFDILARAVPTVNVSVEGSRVTFSNFTPTTSGVEYSFDGGATFSSSPTGYFYTTGSQNILIRYGSCQFTQTVVIDNPLELTASDIVRCEDGSVNPSEVCVTGGVSTFNVRASGGTVTAQANASCPNGEGYIVFPPTGISFVDVSVVDAVGATVVVTVPVTIAPSFTVGGTFIGSTLSVTLNGGTAPFTYSIDGGTTTQADPVFTNLTESSYTVTVSDAFGCSIDEVFMVSSTGDLTEQFGLQVFPNPMSDWLQVTVSADVQVDRLILIDATGRTVLLETTPRNMRLDVSNLASGFYTLVVESKEGRAHVAVVRQ